MFILILVSFPAWLHFFVIVIGCFQLFVHAVVLHFVADSSALHLTNYLGGDVYHVPVLLRLHALHFGHESRGIFSLKV